MGNIRILSEDIANQIAAGEVVERPASVVKELAENALDAGATRIDIVIRDGGLSYISLSDDGRGMAQTDAVLAFERHATSKLKTADDLFCIRSLGFRGEALPSIAAVAQVELITRPHDSDAGSKVVMRGGENLGVSAWGAPPGTQVIVTDLFYNTPARQKFLKSPVAEGGRVRSLVTRLALAAPHVAFRLTQDDRIVIETPGNNSADDTVLALYGREVVSQLFPVAGQGQPVSLRGLISRPQLTRNNRRDQVFVINGRLVECRSLSAVVQEAYRSLLPRGRHPLAFLHLDLQPERVDVNVHPAKIEVRLQEERQVAAVVLRTLREALSQAAAADPAASVGPRATFSVPTQQPQRPLAASPSPVQDESPATQRPLPEVPISLYRNKQEAAAARVAEQEQKEPMEIVTPPPTTAPYRVLGQALQSYIIIEKEDGLQIVDQHAAHERIIYEELLQQTDTAVAPLLLPYTLEVTAREAAVLEHAQAELCALGFTVEHFGGRTWTLRSIPDIYRARFRPEDFLDLVADWAEAGWQKPDKKREQICISLACRGAIKAGQKLHPAEMVELLDRLWHTELPYTCPHGRPIAISFSAQQLFNLFHP